VARPAFPVDRRPARALWIGIAACSIAFVGTTVYRAVALPMSHDEAISYAIFTGEHYWSTTANNHILNTYAMRLCAWLFGSSELSLRLPNVIAEICYLGAIASILSRLRHGLVVPAFLLLTLNLFQFDYFGVARGYGLELGLIAVSLACFIEAVRQPERETRAVALMACSLAAGFGSAAANFSAFYFYAALLAVCAGAALLDPAGRGRRRARWLPIAVVLGTAGLAMLVIVVRATRMQREGMFYQGGSDGFFGDTMGSLVEASLYLPSYRPSSVHAVTWSVAVLIGGYALLGLWSVWRLRRPASPSTWLTAMLLIAVVLPVTQHLLTGFLLPFDRQALFYVPIAWLVVAFAADLASTAWPRARVLIAVPFWLFAAAASVVFAIGFNPLQCHSCRFDTHMKEVLGLIDTDRRTAYPGRPIAVTINWQLEPPLNFYRKTRDLVWLAPLTREPFEVLHHDYLYAYLDDVARLPGTPHTELAVFPDQGTVLWRLVPHAAP
jgi:hypothetical protein